jgi:RNA polymerase sigma factor (sigma-70 family)
MLLPQSLLDHAAAAPAADVPAAEVPARGQAVELLFRRHYTEMLRLAYCLLGERDAAEDAVQDAFASLHAHWGRLHDPEAALAYLRSSVLNRCRSRIRDLVRERAPRAWRADQVLEPSSEEHAVRVDEADRLAAAVRKLPMRQRQVVLCRYYLELSERETASLLEIGTGSVKRHAHRAVQALATRLEAAQ